MAFVVFLFLSLSLSLFFLFLFFFFFLLFAFCCFLGGAGGKGEKGLEANCLRVNNVNTGFHSRLHSLRIAEDISLSTVT